jgi:hypothetical protein
MKWQQQKLKLSEAIFGFGKLSENGGHTSLPPLLNLHVLSVCLFLRSSHYNRLMQFVFPTTF